MKATYQKELQLLQEGYRLILGLDEAGRGPWAGPVSVGGVLITDEKQIIDGVGDSKTLSHLKREDLYERIINSGCKYSFSLIQSQIIDKIGIHHAIHEAMINVISDIEKSINDKVSYLLIDGANVLEIEGYQQERINKGDALHYSISAGSIIAKVARDRFMYEQAKLYPQYQFEKHVGYGTKIHYEALCKYGPCPLHRFSFKPIKAIVEQENLN
ncbi:MAG TPA: ribonuclease HII [Candidatus Dojkabacteria bacterium]|nr:ribonuclease HII [Candidatus Dojkabacteria bacterium]